MTSGLVPDAVALTARAQPDALAVEDGERRVTYRELIGSADALAARLRAGGAGPDTRVAVRMGRSAEQVIAALAVLRAGAAYVPVDPALPAARQRDLLADSGALTVLEGQDVPVVPGGASAGMPADPAALAYLIFTSGSTGRPKAVGVHHAALANLVSWHVRAFRLSPADRFCPCAGVGFDASVMELWPHLVAGACLVIPGESVRRDPEELRAFIEERGVTGAFVPTAMTEPLLGGSWSDGSALRLVHTGGEALRARPRPGLPYTLANHYGPAETTVIATSCAVAPGDGEPTIGRPIDNVEALVMDPYGEPVANGRAGELYVGGTGVGRGYVTDPRLTAERFVPAPGGERRYRTGDLVRRRPDGDYDYCGRVDDQVQIRGQRVEPGEVEAVLCGHPGIAAARVVAVTDASGELWLSAFYLSDEPRPELRGWLAERLPAAFVPADLVRCERLPLTANGKVDRAVLRDWAGDLERGAGAAPSTPHEVGLAAIWQEVLGFPVGVDQPFDAVGGNSLQAVRVVRRIKDRLGVRLPLREFFPSITIAELARRTS
ncbi:non-ribosomal peptide synthetase [Nonomuraea sediminis]|uniref:non-ribosomal peptide synthetase n=1 Tax=Nonomuraea sediminis TaxID=2835864 RepID=UPI001BDC5BAA|nr:non-ribosomal peptide synthetase [Nonomuraea sediminis]